MAEGDQLTDEEWREDDRRRLAQTLEHIGRCRETMLRFRDMCAEMAENRPDQREMIVAHVTQIDEDLIRNARRIQIIREMIDNSTVETKRQRNVFERFMR